jgi:plastocyanin
MLAICVAGFEHLSAVKVYVKHDGYTYSPAELTVFPGDTVIFNIGPHHDAVEVNQDIWEANDTIYNGGFRFPLGGGLLVLEQTGTYYYVCTPHAYLGMKGIIYVQEPTPVETVSSEEIFNLKIYPNPARDVIKVEFALEKSSEVNIELTDITGRKIRALEQRRYQPGHYSRSFDTDYLFPGRYLLLIQSEYNRKIEQLFIAH